MFPVVEVNLKNLASNYEILNNEFPNFWAVLKDNAYGLGVGMVAKTLFDSGCRKFIVADIGEAVEIAASVKNKKYEICILNGLFSTEEAKICVKYRFIPFLSSKRQIDIWFKNGRGNDFAIFLETGLNRLSLRAGELDYLLKKNDISIRLVISHLACARNSKNKRNEEQKKVFDKLCARIEQNYKIIEKSLCASDGAFNLDNSYFYNSVRFGSALYGFSKYINKKCKLKNLLSLKAPIIKTFYCKKGEYIGYGDNIILNKNSYIGILNLGLVNGLYRAMSDNTSFYLEKQGKKINLPVLGRITMDYTTLNLSRAKFLKSGDYVYLFDFNNHIKDRMDNYNYEDIMPRIISAQPLPYHKEFSLYILNSKNNINYIK